MLELRKQLAKRQEELTGVTAACVDAQAAAPAGAAAAKVFQEIGLPDTPARRPTRFPWDQTGSPSASDRPSAIRSERCRRDSMTRRRRRRDDRRRSDRSDRRVDHVGARRARG